MSDFFGEPRLPRDYIDKLETCIAKWDDPDLVEANEAMWKGMITYFTHPNSKDPWVNCDEDPNHSRCNQELWREAKTRSGLGHFG